MRPIACCTLTALFCLCLAAPALAQQPVNMLMPMALRAQPGEQAAPGDPSWPLGQRTENGARVVVSPDAAAPGFRVEISTLPGTKPSAPTPASASASASASTPAQRLCLGLASATRRDLYKTRAVEFRIKASTPVAGIIVVTTSNTQDRASRDRFFGSFGIGTEWKTLRLPYGALAPLPGWLQESARLGFRPGDNVLRPDSVEDLCIGVEAGRLPAEGLQPVTLQIDGPRFVR